MPILFYSQNIKFSLKNKSVLKSWINAVIANENKSPGEINYIFCNDLFLRVLNKKFLKHDTYTDILTFDYSGEVLQKNKITADIYISISRVKENAKKLNYSFESELNRVMIHGILHLCGYNDKTKSEKEIMRKKEEEYLSRLFRKFFKILHSNK